jgi:hypothetical protein
MPPRAAARAFAASRRYAGGTGARSGRHRSRDLPTLAGSRIRLDCRVARAHHDSAGCSARSACRRPVALRARGTDRRCLHAHWPRRLALNTASVGIPSGRVFRRRRECASAIACRAHRCRVATGGDEDGGRRVRQPRRRRLRAARRSPSICRQRASASPPPRHARPQACTGPRIPTVSAAALICHSSVSAAVRAIIRAGSRASRRGGTSSDLRHVRERAQQRHRRAANGPAAPAARSRRVNADSVPGPSRPRRRH